MAWTRSFCYRFDLVAPLEWVRRTAENPSNPAYVVAGSMLNGSDDASHGLADPDSEPIRSVELTSVDERLYHPSPARMVNDGLLPPPER